MEFSGAKTAVFLGSQLLVIQRDDIPDIPWPGRWDLPGGGREGDERVEVVVRQSQVEVLALEEGRCLWADHVQSTCG